MGLPAGGVTGTRQICRSICKERGSRTADAIEGYEDLTDDQLIMEKVLFGLRMNEGIPWDLVPSDKTELFKRGSRMVFYCLKMGI